LFLPVSKPRPYAASRNIHLLPWKAPDSGGFP
jgi:hypothetical protein